MRKVHPLRKFFLRLWEKGLHLTLVWGPRMVNPALSTTGKIIADLAEGNGSLPPGLWLIIRPTCHGGADCPLLGSASPPFAWSVSIRLTFIFWSYRLKIYQLCFTDRQCAVRIVQFYEDQSVFISTCCSEIGICPLTRPMQFSG